ncbi:acyl carrier protein [Pseudoxanthomonas sp. LjRoot143]|uniref:acyl carrier protein n=1 Tax=Pseudoxanthomonas sp. LjRoot143 TaxID=3342266 RepID=UPI003ED07A0E
MESIRQQISAFVATTFPMPAGGEESQQGRSLLDSGAIDSIGVLTLVTWLEEQFGIVVDDEDVVPENLDSIDSLVAFVSGKLGGTVQAG